MNRTELTLNIEKVERIANTSKLNRMISRPISYFFAIVLKELFYPITKKGIVIKSTTFFSKKMLVTLPSSIDIYITKGKSHPSETRLARYMINHIKEGDTVIDIGAHFGYFSLLLSEIVGDKGKIYSFEASPSTYKLLYENVKNYNNIYPRNNAVFNKNELVTFYEFPALYSEYNTSNIEQFDKEKWIKKFKPQKVEIEGLSIDQENIKPQFIKIDVEGGEYKAIEGAIETILFCKPVIAMEYLCSKRNNLEHKKAYDLLISNGYRSFIINKNGDAEICDDIDMHLHSNHLDSDNIIFKI